MSRESRASGEVNIDLAMPTYESVPVLEDTLQAAQQAVENSDFNVRQYILVDKYSGDGTIDIAEETASEHGWGFECIQSEAQLPKARQLAINHVQTDWFWFLDDDVRVDSDYLSTVQSTLSPAVGAVQGRKRSRTEHPSDWVRRRARRAATNAPLVRCDAVADLDIPNDLHIFEDQYIRRHVDASGYVWVFNPNARFSHDDQGRHPIGWKEGYLAGKYGLYPGRDFILNVPFSALTGRNPIPHAKRALGYVVGKVGASHAVGGGS